MNHEVAPSVSVVIPTFNCAESVGEAIQSVLNQSVQASEIIVVDDGSTDDTRSVIGKFGDAVRYLYQSNQGVSAARNAGIRGSNGKFIGFLDADDRWKADKLEHQSALIAERSDIDVVFSRHENVGRKSSDFGQFESANLASKLSAVSLGDARFRIEDANLFHKILRDYLILTSTVLIKRFCFERLGMFDPSLRIAEDTQLWLRLSKNCVFGFVDLPLTEHRVRSESLTGDESQFVEQIIFMFQHLHRWMPDMSAAERADVRGALDYWYPRAYRLFCDGNLAFGPKFFFKALTCDPRIAPLRHLLATSFPEPIVRMGSQVDQRFQWYKSKAVGMWERTVHKKDCNPF